MGSINALQVAKDVSETIRKGNKVVLGQILTKNGYSISTSESPTIVTETKTYKNAMRPLVEGLHDEIERIKQELARKDLSKERYETLVTGLDKLVKNYQLLSGGVTERNTLNIQISEAIAKKNQIVNDTP